MFNLFIYADEVRVMLTLFLDAR